MLLCMHSSSCACWCRGLERAPYRACTTRSAVVTANEINQQTATAMATTKRSPNENTATHSGCREADHCIPSQAIVPSQAELSDTSWDKIFFVGWRSVSAGVAETRRPKSITPTEAHRSTQVDPCQIQSSFFLIFLNGLSQSHQNSTDLTFWVVLVSSLGHR